MDGPLRLKPEVVLSIHRRQVAEHGGDDGIRDENLLLSALARPENLVAYSDIVPDIARLAASYAFGIARNHPFLDGNKRTAYVACRTFLCRNGHDFEASPEEKYLTFLSLAEGRLTEEELGDWIRARLV